MLQCRYFIRAEAHCSATKKKVTREQNVTSSHELNITRVNPTYQTTTDDKNINGSQLFEVGRLNVMLVVCGPITIMVRTQKDSFHEANNTKYPKRNIESDKSKAG